MIDTILSKITAFTKIRVAGGKVLFTIKFSDGSKFNISLKVETFNKIFKVLSKVNDVVKKKS